MEKKKFKKLVELMVQDINSGQLDISWMFEDEENCMNSQECLNAENRINSQECLNAENRINSQECLNAEKRINMQNEKPHKYAKTLYPWCNGNTTENKWREYTLEESGLTHEQNNFI